MAATISRGRWALARHLVFLSQKLVDLAAGRIARLMVMMPPRHGKSHLISHWFPVWYLERWPGKKIILASYEADFAASWGRVVRNGILENPNNLRVKLTDDSTAANRWETTKGGGMVTAGVGGPITGKGADLLIIDDPVKNQEEAYSQTYREKTWEWYRSTAYTRLEPGGGAVLVMTRWHKDDLAGRLLKEMEGGGERWEVVNLPAIAQEDGDVIGRFAGEALWPARYNLEALGKIKQAVGSRVWAALYQQNPGDVEGKLFQRQWFKIISQAPADILPIRFWDLAATEETPKSDPDWTAGAKVGTKDGQWFIYDMRRARGTPKSIEDLIKQTAIIDTNRVPIWIEQEPGSSGKNTIDHYQRYVLPGWEVRGLRATGDKFLRMGPISAAAEAGNLFLVDGSWNKDFLDEAEEIPTGPHDDQMDAVSGAFEVLGSTQEVWAMPYAVTPQKTMADFARLAVMPPSARKSHWELDE